MPTRIFSGFLILLFSVFLWLIPVTSLVYDFRTDVTTNAFYSTTDASTNATVTLTDFIYDDDVTTLAILSTLNSDAPTWASYNGTTRATVIAGLTANTTRTLKVSYDTDALDSTSWDTILNLFPTLWIIIIICFPLAGLVAILIGR